MSGEDDLLDGPRQSLRGEMRPEDSRARAEARARELLDHGVMEADETDRFYFESKNVPDGWSYEWKRRTTIGKEDPAYQVRLAQTGWEPVPANRHPELMPEGWSGPVIERDGLVLMERPKVITDMIRERDQRDAAAPVRAMEERLSGAPAGQFERQKSDGETLVKIGRTYEAPMKIPD